MQKTSSSLTSKHLVAVSATSMVGFPALLLSVRSRNNGSGPRSPVHRLCLLSFSRPPPTARCPSEGRGPSHSLVAIELHHRFRWSEMWINLAGNQRMEKHLHKQSPSAGKFLMAWGNAQPLYLTQDNVKRDPKVVIQYTHFIYIDTCISNTSNLHGNTKSLKLNKYSVKCVWRLEKLGDGEKSEIQVWNISLLFAKATGHSWRNQWPDWTLKKITFFFKQSELAPLIELTEESQRRKSRPPEVNVVPLRENTAWQDWSWS